MPCPYILQRVAPTARIALGRLRRAAQTVARHSRQTWQRRWLRPLIVVGAALLLFWLFVPVVQFDDPLSTVILDRNGELLGASIASDGQWRFGVAQAIPEKFALAATRFEDRRFYFHPGVDPLAILRAAVKNLRRRGVVSGGSTLTMQVVRLTRKGQPRTLREKAIEAALALRLEMKLSKRQILGLWAAYAPMGGNTIGLDAASWRYFGHDAAHLSWAETATLAVLPNSPSLVHPGRNRQVLQAKRDRLLDSLREAGALDALSCELAKQEPLPPAPQPVPTLAPHLLARLQAGSGRSWRTGDASPWVHASLDRAIQVRTTEILDRHHRALEENGIHNAAALVIEVETGRALAYVGNVADAPGGEHGQQVDVVPAPRSTGSILKPLLYASLLEAGEVLPGQLIPDVPTHLGAFHPENFDRAYSGAVPAERALARSLNIPAVRMLRSYGVDRFCAMLRRVGLTTLTRPAQDYGLALILGGAEASLWDIVGAYAGVARTVTAYRPGATRPPPLHAPSYLLADGSPGRREAPDFPLHSGACYLTLKAMLEVERPGEEAAWRAFGTSRPVAWKTGTSYGFRDAWAVGVTPRYVVGVWAGNADGEGRPGLTGYSAAAPMLFEIFGLLPSDTWFKEPAKDLVVADVCSRSGMRAGPNCGQTRPQVVTEACLSAPPCPYCRIVHRDATGNWQVHGDCEPVALIRSAPWFVLPPAMETYYRRQHADYVPPPPLRPDCRAEIGSDGAVALSFIYPKENAQVYVPIEMGGGIGRVVFEAAHRDPESRVFWHLDDAYYGETRDIHQMAMAPAPGKHVLTIVDEAGETAHRAFTVLSRAPRH